MLITNELTRDVLCNELLQIDKYIKSASSDDMHELSQHIYNMVSILMSDDDFVYVDVDISIPDLKCLAQSVVEKKG